MSLKTGLAVAIGVTAISSGNAFGQNSDRIEALTRRIEELTRRLEEMERSRGGGGASAQQQAQQLPERSPEQEQPLFRMQDGRPVLSTPDGNFTIGLTGRIHYDIGAYFQEDAPPNPDPRAVPDLNDGTNFRRAQLGVTGEIFKEWEYTLIMDLGGSPDGTASLNEASLAYKGIKPLTFQIGAFEPPLTLEDSTSSNGITFLERASAVNVATSQTAGTARNAIGVKAHGERWFAGTFLTGDTPTNEGDDEALGATLRVAGRPLADRDYNLHVGAWGTDLFRPGQTSGEVTAVQLRDRPELRVDSNRLADTGPVPADEFYAWGVEVAANWRSFSLQGEYMQFTIDQDSGPTPGSLRPDLTFEGYYALASWVITGESRSYSSARAAYGAPRPERPFSFEGGGWGAWELAYRYSFLDLNDEDPPAGIALSNGGVRGGEQAIHTIGVNWYVNNYIRFMFNYLHVDVDRLNSTGTTQIGQSYDAVALRTQVNW